MKTINQQWIINYWKEFILLQQWLILSKVGFIGYHIITKPLLPCECMVHEFISSNYFLLAMQEFQEAWYSECV
jgi:hypothetical protein